VVQTTDRRSLLHLETITSPRILSNERGQEYFGLVVFSHSLLISTAPYGAFPTENQRNVVTRVVQSLVKKSAILNFISRMLREFNEGMNLSGQSR
jgi:hypothetical protein